MIMSVLVVRQAQPAFGSFERMSPDVGTVQAERLSHLLETGYDINVTESGVAVCSLWRSTETAQAAGFTDITVEPRLNEVLHTSTGTSQLPKEVLKAAERLIIDPPQQPIWVTNELIIAGLSELLEVHSDKARVPQYAEARELPINRDNPTHTPKFNLSNVPELHKIAVDADTRLQALTNNDAPRILEIIEADPSIRDRVTIASQLHSEEDVFKEVSRYRSDKNFMRYSIHYQDDIVGLMTLWRDNGFLGNTPNPNTYGGGYFLDPAHRGRGIASKSLNALIKELFTCLPAEEFIAYCEQDNTASSAVLMHAGLKPTGELIQEPINGWIEEKFVRKAR